MFPKVKKKTVECVEWGHFLKKGTLLKKGTVLFFSIEMMGLINQTPTE